MFVDLSSLFLLGCWKTLNAQEQNGKEGPEVIDVDAGHDGGMSSTEL